VGTMNLGKRCKHGLYCNCMICNFENKIDRLQKENESLKLELGRITSPLPSSSNRELTYLFVGSRIDFLPLHTFEEIHMHYHLGLSKF
jgi:hypothetical protein